MDTALFTNFSNEKFTGFWDGKPRNFAPGESKLLPTYLAKHYAKHLANRELLKIGKERDTSPKVKINQDGSEYYDNINFNEMFNKAFIPSDTIAEGVDENDSVDTQVAVTSNQKKEETVDLNSNIEPKKEEAKAPEAPSVPTEESNTEEAFENNPNKE